MRFFIHLCCGLGLSWLLFVPPGVAFAQNGAQKAQSDLYWLWADPGAPLKIEAENTPERFGVFAFSAGSLPGQKLSEKSEDGRKHMVIRTPRGGLLKVDSAKVVKGEQKKSTLRSDYRRRLKGLNRESAVEHLEMANWIRKMSGSRTLKSELEYHLQETVRIDPNIDEAWKKLGYDEFRGRRFLPENKWRNHGYVKGLRGWVPEVVAERQAAMDEADEELGKAKKAYRVWKKTPIANDAERTRILIGLLKQAPGLLPTVILDAEKSNSAGKMVFLDAIGTVPGNLAQRALIKFTVQEPDRAIRDRAITLLKQDFYNQASAARTIANSFLTSKQNEDVRQAARVLRELDQRNTILQLIDAVVTVHEVANPNATRPGSMNAGFDRTGRVNSFSPGNNQPATFKIPENNGEVVDALQQFTNQNFGYDKVLWKRWYTDANTALVEDLRGGR